MQGMSGENRSALRREAERVVNEIAQGRRTVEDGAAWFSALPPVGRQAVLQQLSGYALQTHVTSAEGLAGVARSGVKSTANPSVMICMDPPRHGFAALPADEHLNAFRVLVAAFSVADTRRRHTHCRGACHHAWHN
ncbi:DUF5958 family protein [Streptacidiphilus neutrinimicus]|uniref:DUF5958 family protein n=1 Tax=Streptacidiphilus neutrinimicus TaxID=105420 RepID=UPI0009FF6CDB|nr:DUF5958 family protein [Streptacidiphilus neutrinimicus]